MKKYVIVINNNPLIYYRMSVLFWIIWIIVFLTAFQESFNKHHSVKHLKGIDYRVDNCGKFAISLKNGVNIREGFELVAKKEKIKSGLIQGIGTIKDPELWSFDRPSNGFTKKLFKGVYQIISASGNITKQGNVPNLHMNVVLSGSTSFNVFGGTLMGGKALSGEFFIVPTGITIKRVSRSGELYSITEWQI